jgi:hypothetical protein
MKIKTLYEKQDEIPEGFADLYTEKDGKWRLTGIEGVDDAASLTEAIRKERDNAKKANAELKATQALLAGFGELDPKAALSMKDELEELRAQLETTSKSNNEESIQKRIDAALARKLGPVERERDELRGKLGEEQSRVKELSGTITRGRIEAEVLRAARAAKVVPEAIDDVLFRAERVFELSDDGKVSTRDQVGVTAGLEPQAWLSEISTKTPHWYGMTVGGGAKGSSGNGSISGVQNPWSGQGWNITNQAKFIREHGADKAKQMAASAGVDVNATGPKKDK